MVVLAEKGIEIGTIRYNSKQSIYFLMEPGARQTGNTDMHRTSFVDMTCLCLGRAGAVQHADAVVPKACFGRRIVFDVPEEGVLSPVLLAWRQLCDQYDFWWAGLLRKRKAREILLCGSGLLLTLAKLKRRSLLKASCHAVSQGVCLRASPRKTHYLQAAVCSTSQCSCRICSIYTLYMLFIFFIAAPGI